MSSLLYNYLPGYTISNFFKLSLNIGCCIERTLILLYQQIYVILKVTVIKSNNALVLSYCLQR